MNVHTVLSDAAEHLVDNGVPTDQTVRGDVERGRRALASRRSRRSRRGISALGLAVIAAAGTAAVTLQVPDSSAVAGAAASPSVSVAPAIRLVAYTGTQPKGFFLDRVPDGWVLQTTDAYVLTLTPRGRQIDPQVDRLPGESEAFLFDGKLAVTLLSKGATRPIDGVAVKVGATNGLLTNANSSGTRTLFYDDAATGRTVVVQVPGALRWTDEQVADFALGVHVTGEAAAGSG